MLVRRPILSSREPARFWHLVQWWLSWSDADLYSIAVNVNIAAPYQKELCQTNR
jgi:hypothetical protein